MSESNGKAVFNQSNGYLAVFHLDDPAKDETGTLTPKDVGTTPSVDVIAQGRHLATGKGILGGEKITTFPTGSAPHSTELWFRAEKSGDRIVCWGSGGPKMMVQMILSKPPRMHMDCYGAGASLSAKSPIPMSEWVHVIHTCKPGESRMYVNGVLDAVSVAENNPLEIKSPVKMFIGGWGNYVFNGDVDEVRISKVARSADWVRLRMKTRNRAKPWSDHWCNRAVNFRSPKNQSRCWKAKASRSPPRRVARKKFTGSSNAVERNPSPQWTVSISRCLPDG